MTNDLVERLRDAAERSTTSINRSHIVVEAADRIDALEKQLSASNRHIMDLEEKIEELEYEIYELGNRND